MATNCAPLLAALFLYYHEADFIQELPRKKDKKLAISLNFTFRYIAVDNDDVTKYKCNSKFGDYVERIYPIALVIKHIKDTVQSASYLDLHLEMTVRVGKEQNLTIKEMISASQL